MPGWVSLLLDSGEAHVVPVDDVMEHEEVECPCGPTVKPVERRDGTIGWINVHMSLDGREKTE